MFLGHLGGLSFSYLLSHCGWETRGGMLAFRGQTGLILMHPISKTAMNSRPMVLTVFVSVFLSATLVAGSPQSAPFGQAQAAPSSAAQAPAVSSQNRDQASQKDDGKYALPRGKKLMLKDGTFQLARSYERNGDRVRYYSVERSQWEEIPAALVDWDATAKAEATEKSDAEALGKKVHLQEEASRMDTMMDVDASLQVAPGVFLPPGEGMFVIDGKHVTQLGQVCRDGIRLAL